MFRVESGDLFGADLDAIAHGCNCQGLMGAGIAVAVRTLYGEEMYAEYQQRCARKLFNPGTAMLWQPKQDLPALFNLATQIYGGPNARYDFIGSSVRRMCRSNFWHNKENPTIGIPAIGCGIGGLEFDVVCAVLENVMQDFKDIDLVMYLLDQ